MPTIEDARHPRNMPCILCPHCGDPMRYLPWSSEPGGKYLCNCGYKFWIATCWGTQKVLPIFRKLARRRKPGMPRDFLERREVMRQWVEFVNWFRPSGHDRHGNELIGKTARPVKVPTRDS